jgi:hypothetical protein
MLPLSRGTCERSRLGLYASRSSKAEGPVIALRTMTLDGDSEGVAPASDGMSYAKKFSGKRTQRITKGIGQCASRIRLDISVL